MIASKHITKFVSVLMAAAVCLCLWAAASPATLADAAVSAGLNMEYEEKLFDPSEPISVNILMDDGKWDEMLQNATSEEYVQCDVEINGTTFYRVGVRPKGNTSLSSIASDPDTERYSFKLEFDQFVEGQTCYGLDKLVLNNNYADATNMKEALIYDMFQYLGADASLYNYAKLSVNGEYWGVYLALEAVEDSFLLRNYGAENGSLYKPENMGMGGPGNGGSFSRREGGGSDLNYTDDELDSYETIWEGEVGNTSKSDHKRVVAALKAVSEKEDLEDCMDVDNLLRYMAVHVFAVNQDSLSGNMAHNYYLYEHNGKLNLLPWDYNLAWGGMGMGRSGSSGASSVVNDAIDTPFDGTDFFDGLLENEAYLEQYHGYLEQLVEEYISNGGFDAFYSRTRGYLDELVRTDPTAFYTYDEYDAAAQMLSDVIELRAESVLGQLNGTIPSTDEGQRQDTSTLIDASSIDLSVMGAMNQDDKGNPNIDEDTGEVQVGDSQVEQIAVPAVSTSMDFSAKGPTLSDTDQDNDAPQMPQDSVDGMGGEPPEGLDPDNMPEAPNDFGRGDDGTAGEENAGGGQFQEEGQFRGGFQKGGMADDMVPGMDGESQSQNTGTLVNNAVVYGICFVILLAALLFATLFHRRSRRR